MKRAVSISLGSSSRDKKVVVTLGGQQISVERIVITTTPRFEGRSFGTNMMEAALTAYAGKGQPLNDAELNDLIDELDLRPSVRRLNA